jgi:von Willebrand factor type A domain
LNNRVIATVLMTMLLFALGCEGGKSKSISSKPQDNNCSLGFTEINGVCTPNSLTCPPGAHEENGRCVTDQLNVTLVGQSACWIPETGAARVIVQYTAKDESGRNLGENTTAVNPLEASFFIDNRPMDSEAQLSSDSELLDSDLVVSLVLDASYSMLQHTPPAFEPMKSAAINILEETQALWAQTESRFDWRVLWFDYALFSPALNMAGEPWAIGDIAHIPAPEKGTFTALYKAINRMVDTHQDLYNDGIAAGPRDQHIMIVLSDGGDNQAHVDNPNLFEEQDNGKMLYWQKQGGEATSLAEVMTNVGSLPNLRTFVIGFGNLFGTSHAQSLKDIAQAGNGQYFFGADANNLEQIFRDVQSQFITLQTLGAEIPLAPGSYQFTLLVRHPVSGSEGRKEFELEVGPILGECTKTEL